MKHVALARLLLDERQVVLESFPSIREYIRHVSVSGPVVWRHHLKNYDAPENEELRKQLAILDQMREAYLHAELTLMDVFLASADLLPSRRILKRVEENCKDEITQNDPFFGIRL